jgi:hypothetical protein
MNLFSKSETIWSRKNTYFGFLITSNLRLFLNWSKDISDIISVTDFFLRTSEPQQIKLFIHDNFSSRLFSICTNLLQIFLPIYPIDRRFSTPELLYISNMLKKLNFISREKITEVYWELRKKNTDKGTVRVVKKISRPDPCNFFVGPEPIEVLSKVVKFFRDITVELAIEN